VSSSQGVKTSTPESHAWAQIPWRKLEQYVFQLQKRIYRARQRGDWQTVRGLQRLLRRSRAAKTLAVRRVTQDNDGKKTPGVDGVAQLTPKERLEMVQTMNLSDKAYPVRRIWIPKPGKTELRPLGIPTMMDRAKQALVKMVLEPEWEAVFEPNSYGFRPGRSCWDAIDAVWTGIKGTTKWILDADIAGCFDNINHQALLRKLQATPCIHRCIKAWLRAGAIDTDGFHPAVAGTPQGGVLSPLLANIALHGLEREVKAAMSTDLLAWYKSTGKRGRRDSLRSLTFVQYADDFLFAHPSKEIIEKLRSVVAQWLRGMGLTLKESKTRITHSLAPGGVTFLGFTIRQFACSVKHAKKGRKTLIKPSREAEKRHQASIKETIRRTPDTGALIARLRPKIVGWSNYYRTVAARKSFEKMDHLMYWKVFAKVRRDGHAKAVTKQKTDAIHARLPKHTDQKITRHIKVKDMRSPFDGDWTYWATRLGTSPDLTPRQAKLLKSQKGRCGHCHQWFEMGDLLEVHHVDGNHRNNKQVNLQLLHKHCHHAITRTMRHDKAKHVEEPCAAKVASTVLKPSGRGDPVA
jgi:RNA-directed DNA polymerase